MANNKNTTTTDTTEKEVLEEDLSVTEDIDYSTLLENTPYCFYYYDKDINKCHIDGTLEVLEDDDNIYVITVKEIITIAKSESGDETAISDKEAKKKQKQIDKFNKAMDKQIKKLNKQIAKGTVKKKK